MSENIQSSSISLKQVRRRPVRVQLFPDKRVDKSASLRLDEIYNIKRDLNLSNSQTLRMARDIRLCTKKRDSVQSGLVSFLSESLHKVDGIFDVNSILLKDEIQPVVFCNNINALIDQVIAERQISGEELIFKVGLDYGGGFLKVCLNIVSKEVSTRAKRAKYEDKLSNCAKDTSVNRLIILALTPENKETHETMKNLWDLLDLSSLNNRVEGHMTVAADLKMANILTGIMPHSSAHPCTWCTSDRYVNF